MAARKPGKVGWGIMSTALIGTRVVIPAMMRSNKFEFPAIASRDQKRADKAAKALGIPVAHGSYETLLDDPDIDVVYPDRYDPWFADILARKPGNVAAVAMANKTARIVWAVLTRNEPYRVRTI